MPFFILCFCTLYQADFFRRLPAFFLSLVFFLVVYFSNTTFLFLQLVCQPCNYCYCCSFFLMPLFMDPLSSLLLRLSLLPLSVPAFSHFSISSCFFVIILPQVIVFFFFKHRSDFSPYTTSAYTPESCPQRYSLSGPFSFRSCCILFRTPPPNCKA